MKKSQREKSRDSTTTEVESKKGSKPETSTTFRKTKDGKTIIPVNQLQNLRVIFPQGIEMTGASIVVEISPGGTTAGLTFSHIPFDGDLGDLNKMFLIHRMVYGSETVATTGKTLTKAAIVQQRIEEETKSLLNFDSEEASSFRREVARIYGVQERLRDNVETLINVSTNNTQSNAAKNILLTAAQDLQSLWDDDLRATAVKKRFNFTEKIAELGIPQYVANKFGGEKVALPSTADVRRWFFPADASKGITLTVAEWRNPKIFERFGVILRDSEFIRTLFNTPDILEILVPGAKMALTSSTPLTVKLSQLRAYVVPTIEWGTYMSSAKNFPGVQFTQVNKELSELEPIEALALIPFKIFTVRTQKPQMRRSLVGTVITSSEKMKPDERISFDFPSSEEVPPESYKPPTEGQPDDKIKNPFISAEFLQKHPYFGNHLIEPRFLELVSPTYISGDPEEIEAQKLAIKIVVQQLNKVEVKPFKTVPPPPFDMSNSLTRPVEEQEKPEVVKTISKTSLKEGTFKPFPTKTSLSKKGVVFLSNLSADKDFRTLVPKFDNFLRSFSSLKFQELAIARLQTEISAYQSPFSEEAIKGLSEGEGKKFRINPLSHDYPEDRDDEEEELETNKTISKEPSIEAVFD